AIIFRLVIGQDIEVVRVILWRETAVDTMNDRPDWCVRSAQVPYVNINSLCRYPVTHLHDQIAAVLGHPGIDQVHGTEVFPLEGLAEDHLVRRNGRAKPVVKHQRTRRLELGIVKPLLVWTEGN